MLKALDCTAGSPSLFSDPCFLPSPSYSTFTPAQLQPAYEPEGFQLGCASHEEPAGSFDLLGNAISTADHGNVAANVHVAFIISSEPDGHLLSLHLLPSDVLACDISPSSLGWRLTWPRMASNLVLHLLDVACGSTLGLPAFEPLLEQLPRYRADLANLSLTSKIAVTVLCVLGARATSHPELFGVSRFRQSDEGTLASALSAKVGRRRDLVCRELIELAFDFCDPHDYYTEDSSLESLVALTQLFTVEETWQGRPGSLLHLTHHLYLARLRECTLASDVDGLKIDFGLALFEYDAISSSFSSRPCDIAESQTGDYIDNSFQLSSVADIPHLPFLDELFSYHNLPGLFLDVSGWVSSCFRSFANGVSSLPHDCTANDSHFVLHSISALWAQIDLVRLELQRRQRVLGEMDDRWEGETEECPLVAQQVLVGLRLDLRLVELLMVIHVFLNGLEGPKSPELLSLLELSDLRMRKSLKLASYYMRLCFPSERGQQLLYNIIVQLELLPNWTHIALQRVGDRDGPLTSDYEVSGEELYWLTRGTRKAMFYTTIAPRRLEELLAGRQVPLSPHHAHLPLRRATISSDPTPSTAYVPLHSSPFLSPAYVSPQFVYQARPSNQSTLPPVYESWVNA